MQDFKSAVQKITPRIKQEDILFYEQFAKQKKLF